MWARSTKDSDISALEEQPELLLLCVWLLLLFHFPLSVLSGKIKPAASKLFSFLIYIYILKPHKINPFNERPQKWLNVFFNSFHLMKTTKVAGNFCTFLQMNYHHKSGWKSVNTFLLYDRPPQKWLEIFYR